MGAFGNFFRSVFGGGAPAPAATPSAASSTSAVSVKATLKAALATVGNPYYFMAIEEGGPSSAVADFALNVVSGSAAPPADALFAIDQPAFHPADVRGQIHYGGLLVIIGKEATGAALDGYLAMSKGPNFAVYRRV